MLRTFPHQAYVNTSFRCIFCSSFLSRSFRTMSTKAPKGPLLKTPKGTRDWVGKELLLRDSIFSTISNVFQLHGATPLDTPVFELRDVLSGKYGEEARLIYNVEDHGGELLALRYDLTVPFARWLAANKVAHIKRYQISKVYRRDQPAIARGRLREFYQCDFDIAGVFDTMIADAEVLRVVTECFGALDLDIVIKINHRVVLDSLFAIAGVPDEKTRPISSAIDKLDKESWENVKKEMIEEKGLAEDVAEKIGQLVRRSGTIGEILQTLRSDPEQANHPGLKRGLDEMELLSSYLESLGASDKVVFDLSLARGLDYYTGLIYEVVANTSTGKGNGVGSTVGSMAAGGRYDNLVGMYSKQPVPCVGVSFGVDRIFTVLKDRRGEDKSNPRGIQVYVMAFGGKEFDGLLHDRMAITKQLWEAGIKAEFSPKVKPRLPQQFKAAETEGVPLAIILGQDELAAGQVRLKQLSSGDNEDRGRLIPREDLVREVKVLLEAPAS
ncbi:histidyl-tRNA synthetase [Xylariaceae sp. FL1651]|nr:histidyl-tRNA synthetase [Xylariaceae sp. FL1651]